MNKSNKKNLILIITIFLVLVIFMFIKYYSGIDNSYYDKVGNLDTFIFDLGNNNIYYYIYIGIFNISTFIVMLFSFINTKYLILATNIVNLLMSVLLFYKLLKNNRFNYNICFYGTIIFMISYLSNIFNEVIYLNYLPFLILGLLSIDKFIKENDKKLFIFSIVMIGCTNYKCLLLSNILFLFYYLYKIKNINNKKILNFILLLIIVNTFLSFIYLPILLYNYEGYIPNYKNEINLLMVFSIIMLLFNKKEKPLLLFLILGLILNYIFKINISVFYPLYSLSTCIILKNIYELKIKKETIYKLLVCLSIVIILFDNDYINYLLTFILIILLIKDNKLFILFLMIYFILYGGINYSLKYKVNKDGFNYINYNDFNLKSYTKYNFPYNEELSLKYVIINDSDNYNYTSDLKKFYINNSNIIYVSKEVKHINNEYIGSGKIIIDTSSIKDKILIIKSTNESIKINNNELENQKYIFINNSDKLEITFSNKFNYNDIECFYMNDNIDINKKYLVITFAVLMLSVFAAVEIHPAFIFAASIAIFTSLKAFNAGKKRNKDKPFEYVNHVEIAKYTENLQRVRNNADEEKTIAKNNIDSAKKRVAAFRNDISKMKYKIPELENTRTETENLISQLSKDKAEHEIKIAEAISSVNTKKEQINYISSEISSVEAEQNNVMRKLLAEFRKYKYVENINEFYIQLNNLKSTFEDIYRLQIKIESHKQTEPPNDKFSTAQTYSQIQNLEKMLCEKNNGKMPEKIDDADIEKLKSQTSVLLNGINSCKENFANINAIMKTKFKDSMGISHIEHEITLIKNEIQDNELYCNNIDTALKYIDEASAEIHQNFGSALNLKTAEIFRKLTGGKYDSVIVSSDFNIAVKNKDSTVEWQYLSSGTIDQAYFSLRLAVADMLSEKDNSMPILIDDAFLQYDDVRTKQGLDFLDDYSENAQIIFFTCHGHLIDMAVNQKLNVKVNRISNQ